MALIVIMVSWACTFLQTNEVVPIKFLQFFVFQAYPNKAVKKERKKRNKIVLMLVVQFKGFKMY